MRRGWGVGFVLAWALLVSNAEAQDTGGSFGASDWGSSSSDYGSSSSDWGSSSSDYGSSSSDWGSSSSSDYGSTDYGSSDYGSSDYGSSDYGSGAAVVGAGFGLLGGLCVFALIVVSVLVPVLSFFRSIRTPPPPAPTPRRESRPMRRPGNLTVAVVGVGLDARARRAVQDELRSMASGLRLDGAPARHAALTRTFALLDRHASAVAFQGGRLEGRFAPMEAQGRFTQACADLRSRFRYETVRRDESGLRGHEGGPEHAHAEEGEGFVVVSIVVAVKGLDVSSTSYDPLVASISRCAPTDLVAFEVIWSPALETDRMSSLELRTLYPELRQVAHDVGRIRCACGVAYAAELGRCPSCGRPVGAR
ncbi:MAG: DUF1517 domain-containing protein [Sandaracinus sp.]|nr:DUF1517 domain-containing protein [Sandaracinus sp.]MCB9631999.1 DUF1517 domain-containing protein [Sandaracinus sp.]